MAYDEGLAQRLTDFFEGREDVSTRKMFGGLCFMVSGHMCCGIVGDRLMARAGPDQYENCLNKPHASEMDFTGKSMKGFVYVSAEGFESDADFDFWVSACESFSRSPPAR